MRDDGLTSLQRVQQERLRNELSDICKAIGDRQLEIRHHAHAAVIAQTALRDLIRLGARLAELLEQYPPVEEQTDA